MELKNQVMAGVIEVEEAQIESEVARLSRTNVQGVLVLLLLGFGLEISR